MNTLFSTKMDIFNTFVDRMKEMIFTSMTTYFSRVEGFTQEMQQVVFKMFQEGGMDFSQTMTRVQETLTTQFGMTEYLWYQIHHYFNLSIYSGIRDLFEIKDSDVKTKPSEEPAPMSPSQAFTYEERLVIMVYMQFSLQMIDEAQYSAEITRLGFTMESINTLFQTKMHIFEKFE